MKVKKTARAIVAHHPKELSVAWAQNIVNRHVPEAKVFNVKLQAIDVGTSTRVRLEVEHDANDRFPARWFVKTPSLALKSRLITALPGFLHKEVSFYRSLSHQVPVKLPRVLAAESRYGRGSTLVMSDLCEDNHKPGNAGDALSAEQASQVIDGLAKLHGHYWDRPSVLRSQRWLNDFSQRMENRMGSLLAVPLMKHGLSRAGNLVAARLHAPALRYAAKRRHVMRQLTSKAQTLVHHDCHPGNIFWSPSGPGFLDWQLVRLGEGIDDVAYFLATALEPEIRRQHETCLLNRYSQGLAAMGKQVNETQLLQRYKAHLVYPFEAMLMTLAIGNMMADDSNRELIRRTAAAVEDHDSFAVLRTNEMR